MITSQDNEKVKFVRSLNAKKKRYEERAFLVEGIRLVEEALERGENPRLALYQPNVLGRTARGSALLARLTANALPVSESVLKTISDTVTPQGIVAVVPFPDEPDQPEGLLSLILDDVRDPGNLGTILRTAAAAGVKTVITTTDCVDPFSPKAVRAGMGAHFKLGFFADKGWPQIRGLVEGRTVFLAGAHAGVPYYQADWARPSALIVSSEAHGASEGARQTAIQMVSIPMAPDVESLNAAVAAGIILFEAFRQQKRQIPDKG